MSPKRLLAALAATLGFALSAAYAAVWTGPLAQIIWTEVQAGTRAAPNSATQGFSLGGTISFHALAKCSDSSTFTAGSAVGYYYSPAQASWVAAPTYANFTFPTGAAYSMGPELQVAQPFGRWLYASSGVTCSGGSWDGGILMTVEAGQQ